MKLRYCNRTVHHASYSFPSKCHRSYQWCWSKHAYMHSICHPPVPISSPCLLIKLCRALRPRFAFYIQPLGMQVCHVCRFAFSRCCALFSTQRVGFPSQRAVKRSGSQVAGQCGTRSIPSPRIRVSPSLANRTGASRMEVYKKYSPVLPLPAGTARLWSGTAEKMVKSGFKSSPSVMIDATLPQR